MKHISSIHELVEFFGGDTALADYLDISQSAVAHWKIRGRIAAGWHLRLLAEVHARGATVDPSVFGLTHQQFEGLFRPLASSGEVVAA
jgi:hypothetical protein